jgi:hypothetical protein
MKPNLNLDITLRKVYESKPEVLLILRTKDDFLVTRTERYNYSKCYSA